MKDRNKRRIARGILGIIIVALFSLMSYNCPVALFIIPIAIILSATIFWCLNAIWGE